MGVEPTQGSLDLGARQWVRVLLELIRLVNREDEAGTEQYLASLRVPRACRVNELGAALRRLLANVEPSQEQRAEFTRLGAEVFVTPPRDGNLRPGFIAGMRDGAGVFSWMRDPDESALTQAKRLIATVVKLHMRGIEDRMEMQGNDPLHPGEIHGFRLQKTADSLMSCIYRHLADLALGGPLLECRKCGSPFLRQHARQVFCQAPPWKGGGASPCAERWKKREQRRRKKASAGEQA